MNLSFSLSIAFAEEVVSVHEYCLAYPTWPKEVPLSPIPPSVEVEGVPLWHSILNNHQHNSLLWDEEDLARRPHVSDSEIAANKRAIDRFNQKRCDATETSDEIILSYFNRISYLASARLSSETVGSMIDRLSILSLKIRAMRIQTERQDVDEEHREICLAKFQRLQEQRQDLTQCLSSLWEDMREGRAYYKIYRQFKMYNDPRLNPQIYQATLSTAKRPAST